MAIVITIAIAMEIAIGLQLTALPLALTKGSTCIEYWALQEVLQSQHRILGLTSTRGLTKLAASQQARAQNRI